MADPVFDVLRTQVHKVGNYRFTCPSCSPSRANANDRCLSVTLESDGKILFHCHHCGDEGALFPKTDDEEPSRPRPAEVENPLVARAMENLDPSQVKFLTTDRRLSKAVLGKYQLSAMEWRFRVEKQWVERTALAFPYLKDGKPYAYKLRTSDKLFSQNGACKTLYGVEHVTEGQPLVIAEGEMDVLSLATAKVENAVSVPNGAPPLDLQGNPPKNMDGLFSWLTIHHKLIDAAPRVILAVDADKPGSILAEELARRIGRHKCFTWNVANLQELGCKDANDVLMKHGPVVLKGLIEQAQPWPVSGLYESSHYWDRLDNLYQNGIGRGLPTPWHVVTELFTVVPGQLMVVTGIPQSGKSQWCDALMIHLAMQHGWKAAVCSFEQSPDLHLVKLMQLYTGKPFFEGPSARIERPDLELAKRWMKNNYFFIEFGEGDEASIDEIIERLRIAVLRYGVRMFIIDPYNYIARPKSMDREDLYITDLLTKLRKFCKSYDVLGVLVAHPRTLQRVDGVIKPPGPYEISGGSQFFNITDYGFTIHRKQGTAVVEVHVWKVRFSWMGKQGIAELEYDVTTGAYASYLGEVAGGAKQMPAPWEGGERVH